MTGTTTVDASVQAVRDLFDAYREHDVDRMVQLCTPGAEFRYVPFEVWLRQRVVRADEKVRTVGKPLWTALIDAFPDLGNEIVSITADGKGNVAAEVIIGGTQAKDFGAIRSSGQRYDLPHVFIFRVDDDGQIDRIVAYWDTADWYQQLGKVEVD